MAKSSTPYFEAVDDHRRRLARIIDRGGAQRLKKIYDTANRELERKIRGSVSRANLKDTFTIHQHRAILSQVKQGQVAIARSLGDHLVRVSKEARVDTVQGLADSVVKLERHFNGAVVTLPIDEASVFTGVIEKHARSLVRSHQESMARYGAHVTGEMEDDLAQSLIQGESVDGAIDRIMETADDEWWQAERIARSELSYAASVAHTDGLREVRDELPDIESRWTEYVDDETGEPLDERVGVDSLAMHGQVAPPGEVFTMPAFSLKPDAKGNTAVPESLVGMTFDATPSRPNGREFLSEWRPSWGISAWRYDGDSRVDVGDDDDAVNGDEGDE